MVDFTSYKPFIDSVSTEFEKLIAEIETLNFVLSQISYYLKILTLLMIVCFTIHSISKIVDTFTLWNIKDSLDDNSQFSLNRNANLVRISDLLYTHNRLCGTFFKKASIITKDDVLNKQEEDDD